MSTVQFSSDTDLGRRFRRACKKRGLSITAAAKEIGYAFAQSIYPILAGKPGFCGHAATDRIERWIKDRKST